MANGQKAGFTAQELIRLRDGLRLRRDYRGLALLNIAIDSMLRVSDLRRLKVSDLRRPDGTWRDTFVIGMRKTDGTPVECALLPHTHAALAAYVAAYSLGDDDELFDVSSKTIERMVKAWAVSLGRDARDFGCHSLRRTKAALMAENCSAQEIDDIRELLGHSLAEQHPIVFGDEPEACTGTRALVRRVNVSPPPACEKSKAPVDPLAPPPLPHHKARLPGGPGARQLAPDEVRLAA